MKISSKADSKYIVYKYCSCLDVKISIPTASIEEGFTFSELRNLRIQVEELLDDINFLLDHENAKEGNNDKGLSDEN